MSHTPRRALLLIDVQNEYFSGRIPISHPDPDLALRNIVRAASCARRSGIPVVAVRQLAGPGSHIFEPETAASELHVAVHGLHDYSIDKRLPSAFAGTELDSWLLAGNVDTVVVAGFMTQNCDAATVFDALHRGYSVEFLSDATGTVDLANLAGAASAEEIHRVFCVVLQSRFASVLPTHVWEGVVASGVRAPRDSILASVDRARDSRQRHLNDDEPSTNASARTTPVGVAARTSHLTTDRGARPFAHSDVQATATANNPAVEQSVPVGELRTEP